MTDPQTEFNFHSVSLSCHAQCFQTEWTVPENLSYFEGHFPGQPILPAVAMLDVAGEILRRCLSPHDVLLKEIKSSKFSSPIVPKMKLIIETHSNSHCEDPNENQWHFLWKDASQNSVRFIAEMVIFFESLKSFGG